MQFEVPHIDDLLYKIKNTVFSHDANNILRNHPHNIMQSTSGEDLHTNARNISIALSKTKPTNLSLLLSFPSNRFIMGISALKDNLENIRAAIEEACSAGIR